MSNMFKRPLEKINLQGIDSKADGQKRKMKRIKGWGV
jgi:hypothetical protein